MGNRSAPGIGDLSTDEWSTLPSYMTVCIEGLLNDYANSLQKARQRVQVCEASGKEARTAKALAALEALKTLVVKKIWNPAAEQANEGFE